MSQAIAPVNSVSTDSSAVTREWLPYGPETWSSLRDDWQRLAKNPEIGSAFLSVSWVDAWWQMFAERRRPAGVRWRSAQGDVVACALLPIETIKLGPFAVRRMCINASGIAAAFCEHNDVLTLPAYRTEVLNDLVALALTSPVDELSLAGFRADATAAISDSWPTSAWSGYVSEAPFVELDSIRDEGVEFLSRLSRNSRSQVRRSQRLYTELYGEPDIDTPASAAEALDWFAELVEMHQDHWIGKGETGAFSDDARHYHQLLIRQTFGVDDTDMTASLLRVRFGPVTVAMLYYLEYAGRANFYQSGLRYDDDDRLKPGLVAHTLAVQHYLDRGFSEYDFLGGDPVTPRYKLSLSTHRRSLTWRELPMPSLRVNLIRRIRELRRRVRER